MPLARATLFAFVVPVLIGIGGCCGGKSGPECLGEVEDKGRVYKPDQGTTEGRDKAQRFACNQYCRDGDPTCDAMIRAWLGTPAGKGKPRSEALYADPRILECVTRTCADRCVADVAAGRRKGKVTCN